MEISDQHFQLHHSKLFEKRRQILAIERHGKISFQTKDIGQVYILGLNFTKFSTKYNG